MASTLITTISRITGDTLENSAIGGLEGAPDELLEATMAAYERAVDELLEPYCAIMLGNGDIIGPVARAGELREALAGYLGDKIRMIDIDLY